MKALITVDDKGTITLQLNDNAIKLQPRQAECLCCAMSEAAQAGRSIAAGPYEKSSRTSFSTTFDLDDKRPAKLPLMPFPGGVGVGGVRDPSKWD